MNGQSSNQGRKKRDIDEFSVKLSTIRIWMHEKDIGKLTRILWAGQGSRLCQQASTNPRVKRFLAAVPYVMNSIKDVHQAVIDNNLETLQAKMEPPVPPALITCRDANGLNLIHKAAGLGHTKILEYLIGIWPDGVAETDITGKTPLHWAASHKNNMRCYTLLTQAGGDEEAMDYKMKSPTYYRHKPHEIERAFLVYVPEAPRVSPDVATDWEALSEDTSEGGKKLDIKIPDTNGFHGRTTTDDSIENTSEVDLNDGISATEEEQPATPITNGNSVESAPATPAMDDVEEKDEDEEEEEVAAEETPPENGDTTTAGEENVSEEPEAETELEAVEAVDEAALEPAPDEVDKAEVENSDEKTNMKTLKETTTTTTTTTTINGSEEQAEQAESATAAATTEESKGDAESESSNAEQIEMCEKEIEKREMIEDEEREMIENEKREMIEEEKREKKQDEEMMNGEMGSNVEKETERSEEKPEIQIESEKEQKENIVKEQEKAESQTNEEKPRIEDSAGKENEEIKILEQDAAKEEKELGEKVTISEATIDNKETETKLHKIETDKRETDKTNENLIENEKIDDEGNTKQIDNEEEKDDGRPEKELNKVIKDDDNDEGDASEAKKQTKVERESETGSKTVEKEKEICENDVKQNDNKIADSIPSEEGSADKVHNLSKDTAKGSNEVEKANEQNLENEKEENSENGEEDKENAIRAEEGKQNETIHEEGDNEMNGETNLNDKKEDEIKSAEKEDNSKEIDKYKEQIVENGKDKEINSTTNDENTQSTQAETKMKEITENQGAEIKSTTQEAPNVNDKTEEKDTINEMKQATEDVNKTNDTKNENAQENGDIKASTEQTEKEIGELLSADKLKTIKEHATSASEEMSVKIARLTTAKPVRGKRNGSGAKRNGSGKNKNGALIEGEEESEGDDDDDEDEVQFGML